MKKFFAMFLFVFIGMMIACHKEDESETTNTAVQYSIAAAEDRTNATWNVNLTNFRYVWQKNVPTEWKNDSKYAGSGYQCNYPKFSGAYQFQTDGNSNLCGIASHMMGVQIVDHPALFDVPIGTNDRAIRLVEYAKRYKTFHSGWNFGNFCAIDNIRLMGKGQPNKKGDITDWNQCSVYTGNGTEWGGSTDRNTVKAFFQAKISTGRPCVALIRVNPSGSCQDATCPSYISTSNSVGTGHMVLVTGLTINDNQGIYKIRFKDPWPNNAQTYEVDYGKFLDSMKAASSANPPVYNAYCINGL